MPEKAEVPREPRGVDAGGEINSLKADIDALRAELVTVVQAIKGVGTSAVATAKRQQGAAADRLVAEAAALGEEIVGAGRTQVAELEERIREQPLTAVGIAFVVGLLFGSLRR